MADKTYIIENKYEILCSQTERIKKNLEVCEVPKACLVLELQTSGVCLYTSICVVGKKNHSSETFCNLFV